MTVRTLIKIAVAVLAAVAAVAVALVALTGVGEESAPATTVPAPRPPAVVETGDPGVGVTVVPSRDELTNLATRPVEAVRVLSPQELLVSVFVNGCEQVASVTAEETAELVSLTAVVGETAAGAGDDTACGTFELHSVKVLLTDEVGSRAFQDSSNPDTELTP